MASVTVHPPKTPVTKGSRGIAKNTIPNVCKMPGPPAPFVPSPLPNIAKSGSSPKGYSKKVEIEGNKVAIRGASFKSTGDIASKGTGGGLISANTHGPAKFITPGSLTVKIEGKGVHLLAEPMLNNVGASGNPPNTGATLNGVDQAEFEWQGCPGHELEYSELTPEAEQQRRDDQQADKDRFEKRSQEREGLATYHDKTGFNKAQMGRHRNVSPARLLEMAVEDQGYADDIGFEQKVAEDTKAVWTGVHYSCKHCSLHGEIDVITPAGVIKECKNNAHMSREQIAKYNAVGPIILGASYAGPHMAVPGHKVRSLRNSAAGQRLSPGKDFDIQVH